MILPRHFVEKPWGRTDLPPAFGQAGKRIGEVWYDREGAPLPVLVKWLFTSEKLSIQVHPGDTYARAQGLPGGKEECWIVTHAEPDARLGIGTLEELSGEDLEGASLSGAIEGLMDWKTVSPGDWFFIPAGTVHAIGAGVTLVEVQQNVDVTYRLYDYGRPRELHLHDAIAVSRTTPYAGRCGTIDFGEASALVTKGPNFTIHACRGPRAEAASSVARLLIPIKGQIACDGAAVTVGEVSHDTSGAAIAAEDDAHFLLVEIDEEA